MSDTWEGIRGTQWLSQLDMLKIKHLSFANSETWRVVRGSITLQKGGQKGLTIHCYSIQREFTTGLH